MTTKVVPTPELDRRAKVLEDYQKIGECIDWRSGYGWQLAKFKPRSYTDAGQGTTLC